ncbi:MAG: hypothetical protein J6V44_05765 [Methanobrevibacter sp.]|nr:hypothetical protein [Methanobrevibacter sp.]
MKQYTKVQELISIIIGNVKGKDVTIEEAVMNAAMTSVLDSRGVIEALNYSALPLPNYVTDPIH